MIQAPSYIGLANVDFLSYIVVEDFIFSLKDPPYEKVNSSSFDAP